MTDFDTAADIAAAKPAGLWTRIISSVTSFWAAFNTRCDCIESTGEECDVCHEMRQI